MSKGIYIKIGLKDSFDLFHDRSDGHVEHQVRSTLQDRLAFVDNDQVRPVIHMRELRGGADRKGGTADDQAVCVPDEGNGGLVSRCCRQ